VLGAIAEFEKTTIVARLAAARRRQRTATGEKVEGRKSHAEVAKALARRRAKGVKISLRIISAAGRAGFLERARTAVQPEVRRRHAALLRAAT
jgi:hypothetical protein